MRTIQQYHWLQSMSYKYTGLVYTPSTISHVNILEPYYDSNCKVIWCSVFYHGDKDLNTFITQPGKQSYTKNSLKCMTCVIVIHTEQ